MIYVQILPPIVFKPTALPANPSVNAQPQTKAQNALCQLVAVFWRVMSGRNFPFRTDNAPHIIINMRKVSVISISVVLLSVVTRSSWANHSDELIHAGELINGSLTQKVTKQTDRPWDLAITGVGFFPVLDSKTGEIFYTRLGHFELDREGFVVLSRHPALRLIVQFDGRNHEPLNILRWVRSNKALMVGMMIDEKDEVGSILGIYSNGEVTKIARIVLAKFFNDGKLKAIAPHIYRADPEAMPNLLASPEEEGMGTVRSHYLEQL